MGTRVSKQEVKVPHFFFGEVSLRNQFNKEIMIVSKKMLRKDQYDEWLTKYEATKTMKKNALLLPQTYQIEEIKKFFACCECPADFQMSLSYEKFEMLYKNEIVQRKSIKKFYQEQELFYILYHLLSGLKEFQINGRRLGDIRPSQIVITNQKDLKMINVASFPWEYSSMDKILEKYNNTTKFYLAPEEIDYLNKTNRGHISDAKAEAFSVGMTLLEASTLENSEDLYQFSPRSINTKMLEERISLVSKKYQFFHGYLIKILKIKPQQRLSGGELWSILDFYSTKICENQRFKKDQNADQRSLNNFRRSCK